MLAVQAARVTRFVVSGFVFLGAVLMISSYFQAIGRAAWAVLLGMARNYLFMWPLLLLLPPVLGEPGIWLCFPAVDLLAATLMALVLYRNAHQSGHRYGLLFPVMKGA